MVLNYKGRNIYFENDSDGNFASKLKNVYASLGLDPKSRRDRLAMEALEGLIRRAYDSGKCSERKKKD